MTNTNGSAFIGTTLALPSFEDEFGFNDMGTAELSNTKQNIVSLYQAGAFFGSFFAYVSAYFLGRKQSLMLFSLVFILGAGMMLGATGDRGLGLILGGRVLAGIGVGAASMITPIYISEISPPAVRGRLVGIYELGWQVGGLVGFWINYGIEQTLPSNHSQWLIPFAVQLIPAGLLLIGAFWIRESPRWLMSKHRREKAIQNLCWIRNLPADDIYIVEEVASLDLVLEEQAAAIGEGFWKPFQAAGRDRKVMWRLFLGCMLFMWQNGSGINAINYYSPRVFASIGIRGTSTSFLTTGIFGVVKTVFTVVWILILIDHLGRRKLLMIGAAGGSVCMWIIGAYILRAGVDPESDAPLSSGGIAAVFFFYLWTVFYTPSWNGTPWVINSEIFDNNTRGLGQASAAASNWFWVSYQLFLHKSKSELTRTNNKHQNFLISRFTSTMFDRMGPSGCGVYFFFASMMILSIFFVFFLIPETKSIPLESMDRLFAAKPTWQANKIILDEDRARDEEFRHDTDVDLTKEKQGTHTETAARADSS